jgi:hypothetical protein
MQAVLAQAAIAATGQATKSYRFRSELNVLHHRYAQRPHAYAAAKFTGGEALWQKSKFIPGMVTTVIRSVPK